MRGKNMLERYITPGTLQRIGWCLTGAAFTALFAWSFSVDYHDAATAWLARTAFTYGAVVGWYSGLFADDETLSGSLPPLM
jgi:hypothetical protein